MKHPSLSKLKDIRTLIFDVDGVLTDGSVLVTESGDMLRAMNIKDGYALQHAVKQGLHVAIISGGTSEGVRKRLEGLGVSEVHLGVKDKAGLLAELLAKYGGSWEYCLYMGDDLPDLEVMQRCGFKACPADAVWQIQDICDYIAVKPGGKGAAREVIEMVMKLQGTW